MQSSVGGIPAGIRTIATAATDETAFVRDLGADTVVDFQTQRFEDAARNVDAVLDLVGGETQRRSFQVCVAAAS